MFAQQLREALDRAAMRQWRDQPPPCEECGAPSTNILCAECVERIEAREAGELLATYWRD